MSKHLRFGRLLSLLAIMLTMSFALAQGQNLSQEKVLKTFGFTTAANPSANLESDCLGTVVTNSTTHTVAVTVPTKAVITALKADFTASLFANVYVGQTPGTGILAVSGVSPAVDYSAPVVLTVEAENHSFENYVVTVTKIPASSAKDITLLTANYRKVKTCPAADVILPATDVTFSGTNITFNVGFGAVLDDMTVYFEISPLATALPPYHPVGTVVDFDSNNDGKVEPVTVVVTAEDLTTKTYTVTPVVNLVGSPDKDLIATGSMTVPSMDIPNASSVVSDATTQIITVVLPKTATEIAPTWKISEYAQMYTTNPLLGTPAEICSGGTFAFTTKPQTYDFWIQAEDGTVSHWQIVANVAPDSKNNDLLAITGEWHKTINCAIEGTELKGEVLGTLITKTTETTGTVTFVVPHSTYEVLVKSPFIASTPTVVNQFSYLATSSLVGGTTLLHNNDTFTVTAENGAVCTYTVLFADDAMSNGKLMLSFGFKAELNNKYSFTWPAGAYYTTEGAIDQVSKTILIIVPFITNLHTLTATFTSSDYSCVYIAESTGDDTPQTSEVTENDFSNSLTYVVRAENGTEERYDVEVRKEGAGENKLTGFETTEGSCFGSTIITDKGVYTETSETVTDIAVSVKFGTDVAALPFKFSASAWAVVKQGTTVLTPDASGVYSGTLGGSPVSFFVTSNAGVTMEYIVTVTPRDQNSAKELLTFKFAASDNSAALGSADAVGVIDETAKTVLVTVSWKAKENVPTLKMVATFTTSPDVLVTGGGELLVPQVSGKTANEFTAPVAYTLWAEDCSTVDYLVTVAVEPNQSTGISSFKFDVTGCGCGLTDFNGSSYIDVYARRINVVLPNTVDITALAPSVIGVYAGATVSPLVTDPQDWTAGPISYTVTAPDGVTQAVWTVKVTNPACTANDILTFSLPAIGVSSADMVAGHGVPLTIDAAAHKIDVTVKMGSNLSQVAYILTLSCGATTTAPEFLDFGATGCVTVTVLAQNLDVQDWTICVHDIDGAIPEVETWSVTAYNCTGANLVDSVAVKMNYVGADSASVGRVFIVNETALDKTATPWVPKGYNLYDWTGTSASSVATLVARHLGNYAAVTFVKADTPVYVKTNGLYSGTYWAFAVSANGRISSISEQSLQLDMCQVDVATVCALRGMTDVWSYRLTGEVFVTYEESLADGKIKYVQDATCGIMIKDQLGVLPEVYGEGAGLTDLIGTLVYSTAGSPVLKFVPVSTGLPTASSIGNVVVPIVLSYNEFKANCYGSASAKANESMLVKIATPMVVFDDYNPSHPDWMYDNLDLATTNAQGAYDYFIQSVFNSPLIGTPIPTVPAYYTGIRTNVNWGSASSPSIYGLITPRKAGDIQVTTDEVISALPNPVSVSGILPGQCSKPVTVKIFNEGPGTMTITALYLDDITASDEFNLVTPPVIPFTIDSWKSKDVTITFCPIDGGPETTSLLVEYGYGKTLVVPITGTTVLINATPYCDNFNDPNWSENIINGWTTNGTVAGNTIGFFKGGWYGGNARSGSSGYHLALYAFNLQTCYAMTPGFVITGGSKYLTFYTGKRDYFTNGTAGTTAKSKDPRKVLISTDNQATWTEVWGTTMDKIPEVIVASAIQPLMKVEIPLAAYEGKTVFFKFTAYRNGANRGEWFVEDLCVAELIDTPVASASPSSNDFGGVQVGSTATQIFSVKNLGVSVLKVTKVELVPEVGADFSLVDTNTYPFEVSAGSGFAYGEGSTASQMYFTVNFSPKDVGVQTGKIVVTYGLYEEKTLEISLTGKGLSCLTAAEAVIGENLAPTQGVWYKYTAEKFQITQITSCDPRNVTVPFTYSWDTYLELYKDCNGTFWSGAVGTGVNGTDYNDDMEAACPTNRANSSLTVVLNAGESVYIFWKLAFPGTSHVEDPVYFHINPSYPIDGDVCETAIPLTLPVVNKFGTTVGFGDDYNISPCSPFSNYMDGNDVVYTITIADGYLVGNILGAYGSIHVLDACPKVELLKSNCKAFTSGPNGGSGFRKKIAAGTYYVIVSTWAPPQTVDFLLNMSWESGSAVDNSDLDNSLRVYPNPTTGKFTVSIGNAEATDMTLELVNISGQVVYRNELKAAYSYNDEIDASTFAKGVYYLKVSDAKGVNIKKVVVQ